MSGGKMTDSGLKYFGAISENKRKDLELKWEESKIDDLKKRMLTRYWKDKISIFDDMIRLNVKTPTYDYDKTYSDSDDDDNTYNLGPMNIDSKLLSNKPISLQRGKKAGPGRMEPVISIEGMDAVCYPNKEARKGRKVGLNPRVLRRMEQCKILADSIACVRNQSKEERTETFSTFRRNGSPVRRPKTVLKHGKKGSKSAKRPETTTGVRPPSTKVSEHLERSNSVLDSKLSAWKSMNPVKRPSMESLTTENQYMVTDFPRSTTSLSISKSAVSFSTSPR